MNLLTRLAEKFKNIKAETKKRITATILAGGIALSGLGMTGCSCNPNENNNTNPPVVTPGGNEEGGTQTPGGTESGGTQTPGGSSGGGSGTQTPGGSSGGNSGGSQTPSTPSLSQAMQNVLNDMYYYYLVMDSKSYGDNYAYNNPEYQPIPYGFLKDEGYDIDKIKKGKIDCSSELYSIDNNLFIELKVENEASTNYLTNYILKYTLSNQELKELKNLFTSLNTNLGRTTYIQAPFFVQELSYLKNPEVKSTSYITQSTLDGATGYFNKKEYLASNHHATYIKSEYEPNSEVAHHTFTIRTASAPSKHNSKIGVITITTTVYVLLNWDNHSIENSPNLTAGAGITDENKTSYESSFQSIISYTSRNHYLKNIKALDNYEDILNK